MNKNKKAIGLFLLIVISLSAVFETLTIITENQLFIAILMWIPATAAWICKFVFYRKEKHALLFRKCKIKDFLLAMILPIVYLLPPYIIFWLTNPGARQLQIGPELIGWILFGNLLSLITALGEEIGWRGFLLPRLHKEFGLEKALLFSCLIWCSWHLPLLISGIYMPGTPMWYKILLFFINIGACGVIICIITLRTQSVWPAAILHAAHNNYDQTILGAGTVGDNKMYFVSETGVITSVFIVGLAIFMYISYKKWEKNNSDKAVQE